MMRSRDASVERAVGIGLVLATTACGGGTAAPARFAPASPPTSRDVLLALSAHAAIDPADESCTHLTGDLDAETIGVIEAHLLAQLADAQAAGDPARLTIVCEPSDPPYRCGMEVRIEGDDPWHYAIRFELDESGAIDPASVTCPGV